MSLDHPIDVLLDDLFTAPVIRTSRPATGGRRSGVRGFSPESAQESSPPFDATPVLTPLAPEPTSKILPVKPTKKMTDDWDDGDLDIDIDSLLTDTDPGKSKASVATAAKNVGKEQKPLKQQEPLDDSIDNFPIPVVNSAGNRPNTAPAAQERDIDIKVPEIVAKTDDTTSSNKSQKNNDDDVDLGFVPSFLESGREPRSRRYAFML